MWSDRMGRCLKEGGSKAEEGLWQDRGRDGKTEMQRRTEREICHLLSVPPAPLSCILPGGKYTLMSEGDRGKRMSEVGVWKGVGMRGANRGLEKMDRIEEETKKGEIEKEQDTVIE